MVKSADNGSVSVAPFLKKCYDMADDDSTDSIISWGQNIDSFVVWDRTQFCIQLLPKYFKHSNFSSFVRQLNIYVSRTKDSTVSQQVKVEPKVKDEKAPALEDAEVLDEVEENKKRHLNVVFIGHVDAGKSTIGGQILFLSGQVSKNMRKKQKIKVEKAESWLLHCLTIIIFSVWYMAYIMDSNEEERIKGITVEVRRACFESENTRFAILDAPGHKSYALNMISGAAQADIGVLVISAHKGEFETGYEGLSKLFVVVNKLDDPTVNWSKKRYDEIESKMVPFLRSSGYNMEKDVQFLPITGLLGFQHENETGRQHMPLVEWLCLFEVLDAVEISPRDAKGPFRMPIIDKFKDMGTVVMGKVESSTMREGDSLLVMPNKGQVKVLAIYCDKDKASCAGPGENLQVKLSGIEEEDILSGFVLCGVAKPIPTVTEFTAQLQILELLDNAIFTAGYKAVLHIHSVVEECDIVELLQQIDPNTRNPWKRKLYLLRMVLLLFAAFRFSDFARLGRFSLRTEGKTVAVGKVMDIP
ncbi:hypothetical protein SLE2022_056750 [Rubroshorea leprosula]